MALAHAQQRERRRARGVPAFAGKIDLARGLDGQRQAAVAVGHHVDMTVEDRQLGVVVELAHVEARSLAAEQTLAGQHVQRCVAGDFSSKTWIDAKVVAMASS